MSNATRKGQQIVPVLFPKSGLPYLDRAVKREDTDRSKFIRRAVREKMAKVGVVAPEDGE